MPTPIPIPLSYPSAISRTLKFNIITIDESDIKFLEDLPKLTEELQTLFRDMLGLELASVEDISA